MSIASGFTKMKNYILTSSGYKLLSRWTSSQTVHMGDGTDDTDTVEYRFGAIKGITTSTNVSETGYAADAKTVSEINQSLTEITPHTVSVTDSFLSYIEIIRQRCYLKNNTLYLNLWLNIKNKAAIKSNDAIIWLNLHANNIDLKADGVNGGRAFFIIDDNCIKLNVFSEESDDSYLLICPVTIKTL